jgi:hypothetical protein
MKLKRSITFGLATCGLLLTGQLSLSSAPHKNDNLVETTFAFFGCNRIDAKDADETRAQNPSSANVPQLKQNLTDIAKLAPNYVFFGGDLVMGYADDQGEVLRTQMSAWVDLVKSLPKARASRYIAISGNHELNRKRGDFKLPSVPADAVWTSLVTSNGLVPEWLNGPTPTNSPNDQLVTDQSALSFSFNSGSIHFVVLNTDTRVTTKDTKSWDTKIGMTPVHWLLSDLNAAQSNPKIKSIVVMGHRNLVEPSSVKGDAPIDSECAAPMIDALKSHSKVRAYVCAHVHAFDITEIGNAGLRQVTFGNGGSKLEPEWKPCRGRTFGFGYFKAYRDGSLGVVPYLRPEPANYIDNRATEVVAAKAEAELIISARK